MGFLINMIFPDGEEELQDTVYETEEEAEEAGSYLASCFSLGEEILKDSGDDYMDGDVDFEIIEEDDD